MPALRAMTLLAALAACKDPVRVPPPVEEAFVPGCSRDVVRLQVSAGTEPRFTWERGCLVSRLTVRRYENGALMWSVYSGGIVDYVNGIASGVTYGVMPAGAQAWFDTPERAVPLVPGELYVLTLESATPPLPGEIQFYDLEQVATLGFRP